MSPSKGENLGQTSNAEYIAMAQKRAGRIAESIKTLEKLEERYRGRPEIARIQALRILRDNPSCTIEDVATAVSYSRQSVTRWLKVYREEGLDALLQLDSRKRLDEADEALTILRTRLSAGEFSDLESVKEWIDEYREIGSSLRTEKRADTASHVSTPSPSKGIKDSNSVQSKIPDGILEFLSTLEATADIYEWAEAFRKGLRVFLGDVDIVSAIMNLQCELLQPYMAPQITITQSVINGVESVGTVVENTGNEEQDHVDRLLENFRRRGFEFDKYYAPNIFVYYYKEKGYLGAIILWREREKEPISPQTIAVMRKMHHFLGFLISNFVAWHQLARPSDHTFGQAIEDLALEAGLTIQERRILYLQLLGLTYEEIADTLRISLNTVRSHMQSLYRKTSVHSQVELFAKYFTPRIDSPKTHR